ncbi:flagellar motor protein MotB [Isoptericola jiangsuensis]|uniref:Flagellar motor protein MotB n=1 Tax=Isoptericola jiangsuensis TaxID=548579 RepID=A0A2A9EU66_9MICO|nr:OmpA family protein [Isoptericola jiangsuensis]PFG42418.1 flagellar motor protein MotB [Isoptericola jiangsuensis]
MSRPTRNREPSHEDSSHWISFSDLMSALLLVFLLAVVLLVLSLTYKQQELVAQQAEAQEAESLFATQRDRLETQVATLSEREEIRSALVREISTELKGRGIAVEISEDAAVLHIPTSALGFDSGSYEIHDAHRGVALTIGTVISETVRQDRRFEALDTVFVEGHTDSEAFSGLEGTGNWGLSTFRAISLWRLWEEELPPRTALTALLREDGQPVFSVSGYADSRPVEISQASEQQMAANRRIDIRFTVKGPTADELADIVDGSIGASAAGSDS